MKSISIKRHGGPDVLELINSKEPECKDSLVKVKIKACAINHLDIWVRRGFKGIELPLILGSDASGVIIEVGSNVREFKVGDDVVIQPGVFNQSCNMVKRGLENFSTSYGILGETQNGVQSEIVVLNEENIFLKPTHLSYEESSSMQLVFMTAYQMIVNRANLIKNESILIYGASSGVGTAAIQIAKDIGATVITTVGSKNKIEYALKCGADHVIMHDKFDIKKQLDKISIFGVDVVFEHIGFKTWKESLKVLRKGGRIVTCGATTGNMVDIDLNHLFMKQHSILGSTMGSISAFHSVMNKINNKIYKPFIDKIFKFSDVSKAHSRIEKRKQIGKIILIP